LAIRSSLEGTSPTMDPSNLKLGELRISTMVVTADLGTTLNLQRLLDHFHEVAIPLTWPAEGFLKVEYKPIFLAKENASAMELQKAKLKAKAQEKIIIGTCSRDELTKRKKSKNIFFNQSTLVVRRQYDTTKDGYPVFKEVNIKLFKNGGIQMTGIPSDQFAQDTLAWLATMLQTFSVPVLDGKPKPHRYSIQLINSDYQVNGNINRERLHEILVNEYNLFSSFESTIYQGCDTKYFYNEAAPINAPEGICPCGDTLCAGNGDGRTLGQCKEITISPFHTGSIIITGARRFEQIQKAYVFMNKILTRHCHDIIKPFPEKKTVSTSASSSSATKKAKATKITTKRKAASASAEISAAH
jgi:TATA-box binding protein (TBP) (component of TFIID and TFIIIB)